MPTRRRTSPLKLEPKGDMKELKKLMKDSPVMILVVFANWCGHCQTMKKNVWDPMCKRKNVNADHVAAVESSVLESAGEEGKEILNKVEGFPTVLQVVNGKIAKSLPPPQSPNELEELVNNAEQESNKTVGAPGATPFPKTVANVTTTKESNYNMPTADDIYENSEPIFTPQQQNQSSSLFTPKTQVYQPDEDILLTRMGEEQKKPFSGGGNLLNTMRNISSGILPAGVLGLSTLAMRGGRRYRKGKKSRKMKHIKKSRKVTRKH